eukprot:TRINITY_DN8530_c0_g1_i1.p2 TRINITY_DN8530_c0_g1~~TRINITY_DN8530_c0_g1_i1.p2  ORF type:complete len:162 (-),score=1.20 TRINITY_DN8530_c0_g1_i1:588-1073(-)
MVLLAKKLFISRGQIFKKLFTILKSIDEVDTALNQIAKLAQQGCEASQPNVHRRHQAASTTSMLLRARQYARSVTVLRRHDTAKPQSREAVKPSTQSSSIDVVDATLSQQGRGRIDYVNGCQLRRCWSEPDIRPNFQFGQASLTNILLPSKLGCIDIIYQH